MGSWMCVRDCDVRRVLGDLTLVLLHAASFESLNEMFAIDQVPDDGLLAPACSSSGSASSDRGVRRRVGDYGRCACSTAGFPSTRFSTRTRYRGGLGPFASRRLQLRDPWPAPERTCLIWPHLVRLRSETAHARLPGDANKAPSAWPWGFLRRRSRRGPIDGACIGSSEDEEIAFRQLGGEAVSVSRCCEPKARCR